MERHIGVLVGNTAHFDEVAVCGVCGAVLWVSFDIFFFGGGGRDGMDNVKGKGGKRRRGEREKGKRMYMDYGE